MSPRSARLGLLLALAAAAAARAEDLQRPLLQLESIEGPVRITGDRLRASDGGRRLLVTGSVRLRARGLEARADRLEVWPRRERAELSGKVRLLQGRQVVLCRRLVLRRNAARALLERATVLVKRSAAAPAAACCAAAALEWSGHNALRLEGRRWERAGKRHHLTGVRFTPCDCGPDEAPSWELRAAEADVIADERAWLRRPVVVLKGLPVLALPVAYLPLSERRSGLLMPQFNYSGRDGFLLSESLFVTLGAQADTTLAVDWIEERGWRERLEVRAVPLRRSWFVARVSHIGDRKAAGDSGGLEHRFSAELDGWLDAPGGLGLRAAVRLYSDSDIKRDFMSEMAGRAADAAPSRLSLFWSGDDQQIELDAAWFQDLRLSGVDLFTAADAELHQRAGMDPVGDTIQRLGAVSWRVLPLPLFGWPVRGGLVLEAANLSSLQAAWRDWGLDGTPNQREPRYSDGPSAALADRVGDDGPGGEGDGVLGAGELRRALRLRLEPELGWSHTFGRFARLEGRLAHRQLVYLAHGPAAPAPSTRGITFARLELGSRLERTFGGDGRSIGHSVSPRLRLAGAWRGADSGAAPPVLDLYDRLLTDAVQLSAGLETGLARLGAGSPDEPRLRLWLDQGVDLRAGGLAQLSAGLELDWRPVHGRLQAQADWSRPALAELDAAVWFVDRRGDSLRASYLYLPSRRATGGPPLPLSERTQLEPGLLFGVDPHALRGMGEGLHVLGVDAGVELLWGLRLSGGVHLDLRARDWNTYSGGLRYRSDCGCWGISATFRMLKGQSLPDFFLLLDLGPLGRAGASTAARI